MTPVASGAAGLRVAPVMRYDYPDGHPLKIGGSPKDVFGESDCEVDAAADFVSEDGKASAAIPTEK